MEESEYEKYYYECMICGRVTGRFNCEEGDLSASKCPTICHSCRGKNAQEELTILRSLVEILSEYRGTDTGIGWTCQFCGAGSPDSLSAWHEEGDKERERCPVLRAREQVKKWRK